MVDGKLTQMPNRIGEIAVRGNHVISDYLDTHQEPFHEGWFMTGDLGYFDEDSYLFIKGRLKEMISRGGEKVASAEVENVLNQLDFVGQVAVIGLPDEIYGESVTAVIIPNKGRTHNFEFEREQLHVFAAKKLAKFQQLTQVYFVSEFLLNATGKVIRSKLREQLMQQASGEAR